MVCFYYVEALVILSQNVVKVASSVRKSAVSAVLESLFIVFEIAAAFISESVKRTITEKAIEILHVLHLVTWKKLALLMLKKLIILSLNKTTAQFMTSVLKHRLICSTIIHPLSRIVKLY